MLKSSTFVNRVMGSNFTAAQNLVSEQQTVPASYTLPLETVPDPCACCVLVTYQTIVSFPSESELKGYICYMQQ